MIHEQEGNARCLRGRDVRQERVVEWARHAESERRRGRVLRDDDLVGGTVPRSPQVVAHSPRPLVHVAQPEIDGEPGRRLPGVLDVRLPVLVGELDVVTLIARRGGHGIAEQEIREGVSHRLRLPRVSFVARPLSIESELRQLRVGALLVPAVTRNIHAELQRLSAPHPREVLHELQARRVARQVTRPEIPDGAVADEVHVRQTALGALGLLREQRSRVEVEILSAAVLREIQPPDSNVVDGIGAEAVGFGDVVHDRLVAEVRAVAVIGRRAAERLEPRESPVVVVIAGQRVLGRQLIVQPQVVVVEISRGRNQPDVVRCSVGQPL